MMEDVDDGLTPFERTETRCWAIERALDMPREIYVTADQIVADAAIILAFVEKTDG